MTTAEQAVVAAAMRLALALRGQQAAGEAGNFALCRIYESDQPFAFDQLMIAIEAFAPGFLDPEKLPLPPVDGERCWICGCTDDHACEEGCSWIDGDLCSRCVLLAKTTLAGRSRMPSVPIGATVAQRQEAGRKSATTASRT